MAENAVRIKTDPDPYEPFRLAQAYRVGDLIFVSGQTAIDLDGTIVGVDNFDAQAEQTFKNLAAVLEAGGLQSREDRQGEHLPQGYGQLRQDRCPAPKSSSRRLTRPTPSSRLQGWRCPSLRSRSTRSPWSKAKSWTDSAPSAVQEIADAQPRIDREAAIQRHPLAAVLDGERRVVSVGQAISRQLERAGHSMEDAPMTVARSQRRKFGLREQRIDKGHSVAARRRRMEYPGVRQHPEHAAQHQLR